MIVYLLIFLLTFLLYGQALSFFFVGDDAGFLAVNSWKNIVLINPDNYHYVPIPWLVLFWTKQLFSTNPLPYHLLIIFIHLLNAFLVFNISQYFIRGKIWRWLTTIFFIIFFANYEVVFWITGIFIELSLTFFLIGFKFFLRFLSRNKTTDYLFYALSFLFAILSHEYGITLIFFSIFYLIFYKRKVLNFKKIVAYTLMPFCFFVMISILKIFIVKGPLMASPVSIKRFLASLINFYSYVILPNPYFWDLFYSLRKLLSMPILIIILLIFLSLFFILFKKNRKTFIFLFSWMTMAIIIFSATSWPQMRYFYFLALPSSLLWVKIISTIKRPSLVFLIILGLTIPQFFFLKQRLTEWSQASLIAKETLTKLGNQPVCQTIKNLKWQRQIGDDRWKAYIITSPGETLKFFYGLNCNEK